MRSALALLTLAAAIPLLVIAQPGRAMPQAASRAGSCPSGYVDAQLSWGVKCLHAGGFCKVGNVEYHQYGFDCPASGRLTTYSPLPVTTTTAPVVASVTVRVGQTVSLGRRGRVGGCVRGSLPDRRCSPGAYSSGLTRAVLCSSGFHTSSIRNVPQSVKFAVEREYGMQPGLYGRTIEIDHIVSLELGGSNTIANLYPEPGSGRANYHSKDRLENRLHDLVCAGRTTLRTAQNRIAANWISLYRQVFGVAPGR